MVRRVNSLVGGPRSYVVLVDPDGLGRCRHPKLVESERLVVGILEPVDLSVGGGGYVSLGDLERLISEVEYSAPFGDEPDVTCADVIVGGGCHQAGR